MQIEGNTIPQFKNIYTAESSANRQHCHSPLFAMSQSLFDPVVQMHRVHCTLTMHTCTVAIPQFAQRIFFPV